MSRKRSISAPRPAVYVRRRRLPHPPRFDFTQTPSIFGFLLLPLPSSLSLARHWPSQSVSLFFCLSLLDPKQLQKLRGPVRLSVLDRTSPPWTATSTTTSSSQHEHGQPRTLSHHTKLSLSLTDEQPPLCYTGWQPSPHPRRQFFSVRELSPYKVWRRPRLTKTVWKRALRDAQAGRWS